MQRICERETERQQRSINRRENTERKEEREQREGVCVCACTHMRECGVNVCVCRWMTQGEREMKTNRREREN